MQYEQKTNVNPMEKSKLGGLPKARPGGMTTYVQVLCNCIYVPKAKKGHLGWILCAMPIIHLEDSRRSSLRIVLVGAASTVKSGSALFNFESAAFFSSSVTHTSTYVKQSSGIISCSVSNPLQCNQRCPCSNFPKLPPLH